MKTSGGLCINALSPILIRMERLQKQPSSSGFVLCFIYSYTRKESISLSLMVMHLEPYIQTNISLYDLTPNIQTQTIIAIIVLVILPNPKGDKFQMKCMIHCPSLKFLFCAACFQIYRKLRKSLKSL